MSVRINTQLLDYLQWKLDVDKDKIDYIEVAKVLNMENHEAEMILDDMYNDGYLFLEIHFDCEKCMEHIKELYKPSQKTIECSNCDYKYNLDDYIRNIHYHYIINKNKINNSPPSYIPFKKPHSFKISEEKPQYIINNKLTSLEVNKMQNKLEKDKVFIVHGHGDVLKLTVCNWLYQLELDPIILHEMPNGGTTSILEKIKKYSDVNCAIVLMTADDVGRDKTKTVDFPRARQNVILEAGYFMGKLDTSKVIILMEDGVENPGDLGGCIYIKADTEGGWKELVRREFDSMQLNYKK